MDSHNYAINRVLFYQQIYHYFSHTAMTDVNDINNNSGTGNWKDTPKPIL